MNSPLQSAANQRGAISTATGASSLADVLERVLDKGIVIAGDISVSVAQTELLNIRIRLLISSVDKAKEIGINWWENNPHWTSQQVLQANQQQLELQAQTQALLDENRALTDRIAALEAQLNSPYPQ